MTQELEIKKKDKGFLTLFTIMTVTLIVAMCSAIPSTPVRISIQVVAILLQYVLVKNLIDYYNGSD